MKHPGDELYATLAPAFAERGVSGFAEPLERLARLVEDGAPLAEVEAAYEQVRQGIAAAEAGAPEADLAARFRVIANLVRTAAEEYDVALDDGRVVNAHEYQDALGFVRAAHAMLDALPADGVAAREVIATADAQLGGLAGLWPNLVPPATLAGDPSDLFGAAARIEIAGLHLD